MGHKGSMFGSSCHRELQERGTVIIANSGSKPLTIGICLSKLWSTEWTIREPLKMMFASIGEGKIYDAP